MVCGNFAVGGKKMGDNEISEDHQKFSPRLHRSICIYLVSTWRGGWPHSFNLSFDALDFEHLAKFGERSVDGHWLYMPCRKTERVSVLKSSFRTSCHARLNVDENTSFFADRHKC
jgi:hypothetical protein